MFLLLRSRLGKSIDHGSSARRLIEYQVLMITRPASWKAIVEGDAQPDGMAAGFAWTLIIKNFLSFQRQAL